MDAFGGTYSKQNSSKRLWGLRIVQYAKLYIEIDYYRRNCLNLAITVTWHIHIRMH